MEIVEHAEKSEPSSVGRKDYCEANLLTDGLTRSHNKSPLTSNSLDPEVRMLSRHPHYSDSGMITSYLLDGRSPCCVVVCLDF